MTALHENLPPDSSLTLMNGSRILDIFFASCHAHTAKICGYAGPTRSSFAFGPRQRWMSFVVLLVFLVPYTLGWGWDWWKFGATSAVIVLLWRWASPDGFTADLGIRWRRLDFGLAILSLLVAGIGASRLIPHILQQHGYVSVHTDLQWMVLATPLQTLNEEMVLRALFLTALAHVLKVRSLLSFAVAGLFALLHFVLYRFGPPHTGLSVQALTTLLLLGFAFNELFLVTGSIAIPWGIHLGWNLTRYGNDWIGPDSAILLQGQDFNLIEGNPSVIALALTLAFVASAVRFHLSSRRESANGKAIL